jgi:hypothetical protein
MAAPIQAAALQGTENEASMELGSAQRCCVQLNPLKANCLRIFASCNNQLIQLTESVRGSHDALAIRRDCHPLPAVGA